MTTTARAPLTWGGIVALSVGVALVAGLLIGLLDAAAGIHPGTAGIGAVTGSVAAILIARRRKVRKAADAER